MFAQASHQTEGDHVASTADRDEALSTPRFLSTQPTSDFHPDLAEKAVFAEYIPSCRTTHPRARAGSSYTVELERNPPDRTLPRTAAAASRASPKSLYAAIGAPLPKCSAYPFNEGGPGRPKVKVGRGCACCMP